MSTLEQHWRRLQDEPETVALGIAIAGPAGIWTSPEDPLAPRFYWASVGKLFTSVLLHQLSQEGSISLGESLDTWYPDLPQASEITLDMLLSHRSGFASHNEFPEFRNRDMPVTPEEIVGFLRNRPLLFCPGTDWHYSNSGYVLLGQIIEAETGLSYAESVRERIADPIGAVSIQALSQLDEPADVTPITPPDGSTPMTPGAPFSAGNIVATPRDMLRFLTAVLDGRLTGGAVLSTLAADLFPMFEPHLYYGRGIMVYELPDDLWAGHSGGTEGARAMIAFSFNTQTYAAVALTGEGSAESIANLFLRTLESLNEPLMLSPPGHPKHI
jgi:D-alanyl-D-alanine carboxypeptidase